MPGEAGHRKRGKRQVVFINKNLFKSLLFIYLLFIYFRLCLTSVDNDNDDDDMVRLFDFEGQTLVRDGDN